MTVYEWLVMLALNAGLFGGLFLLGKYIEYVYEQITDWILHEKNKSR